MRKRGLDNIPDDVTVRALDDAGREAVRRVYGEGIATGYTTFDTAVPGRDDLDARWLPRSPVDRRNRRPGRRLGCRQPGLGP